MTYDQFTALLESRKRSTNHPAHMLLTLITFGLWFAVWVFCDVRNSRINGFLDYKQTLVKKHFDLATQLADCVEVRFIESLDQQSYIAHGFIDGRIAYRASYSPVRGPVWS